MHRAGPGERWGGSYGRRTVATAKWAAMQISGGGKGLSQHAAATARETTVAVGVHRGIGGRLVSVFDQEAQN